MSSRAEYFAIELDLSLVIVEPSQAQATCELGSCTLWIIKFRCYIYNCPFQKWHLNMCCMKEDFILFFSFFLSFEIW